MAGDRMATNRNFVSTSLTSLDDVRLRPPSSGPSEYLYNKPEGRDQIESLAVLPRPGYESDQMALELLGFKIGVPVDPYFVEATIPPGWSKRTDGYEVSESQQSRYQHYGVADPAGRIRVVAFYRLVDSDYEAFLRIEE